MYTHTQDTYARAYKHIVRKAGLNRSTLINVMHLCGPEANA